MAAFTPLFITVLTVSDTRTQADDTSGAYLAEQVKAAGHHLVEHKICKDNLYQIRAELSHWIAAAQVQAVLITGGTGLFRSDITPEAVLPLLDKEIPGFGELFRSISFNEIGTSTIQSRCLAGIANNTLIFALPGSTAACRTAWGILKEQLDSSQKLCNFVKVLQKDAAKHT